MCERVNMCFCVIKEIVNAGITPPWQNLGPVWRVPSVAFPHITCELGGQPPPFGKSALASAPRCACSAAPVSIRRPRSRVPRLGTRLGGSRFKAVLRCVRPHCPAGVVPVPFRQRGKLPRRTDFGAWLTQTTYGRDIQWMIELKGGGGRNHTQVIGRNHTPVLPLPQCHKDR